MTVKSQAANQSSPNGGENSQGRLLRRSTRNKNNNASQQTGRDCASPVNAEPRTASQDVDDMEAGAADAQAAAQVIQGNDELELIVGDS